MSQPEQTIARLSADVQHKRTPFDEDLLPEQWALGEVKSDDELAVLSFGTSLDYNRSAGQLWENIVTLYHDHGWEYFDPVWLDLHGDEDELASIFSDIGFRYSNRDAKGWMKNSRIVADEFGGHWSLVLEHSDYDALRLQRVLDNYDFMYLSGDKLAPFYCKVVDANWHSLERVEQLDVPVDVHVRRLTRDLTNNPEMSDDEIRDYWRDQYERNDVNVMAVDTGLWIVGNQWDNWGKDYWEKIA